MPGVRSASGVACPRRTRQHCLRPLRFAIHEVGSSPIAHPSCGASANTGAASEVFRRGSRDSQTSAASATSARNATTRSSRSSPSADISATRSAASASSNPTATGRRPSSGTTSPRREVTRAPTHPEQQHWQRQAEHDVRGDPGRVEDARERGLAEIEQQLAEETDDDRRQHGDRAPARHPLVDKVHQPDRRPLGAQAEQEHCEHHTEDGHRRPGPLGQWP